MIRRSETENIKNGFYMNLYLPVYQWNVEKVLLQNNDQMLRNGEYKEWSLFQCVFVCVPVECRKSVSTK